MYCFILQGCSTTQVISTTLQTPWKTFTSSILSDGEAYYLSGLVYLALIGEVNIFKKVGMANNALSSWKASVAADPGNLDSRYAIFAYYTNAPRIAGGDLDIARAQMNEIEQLDKAYGAMAKGLLLSKEKDMPGAEAAFQEAAALMNRAGPYFSLAQFYMQTEQYEKAISSVQQFQSREKRWWDPDVAVASPCDRKRER